MIEIFVIHIKFLRGNFIIIISNNAGKILFSKSSGNLGFKNSKKQTKDALNTMLILSSQYILNLDKEKQLFLKIEGVPTNTYYKQINLKLLKILQKHNILLLSLKIINKVSHNGCRKEIHRK
jgi:ribosomal protein S11